MSGADSTDGPIPVPVDPDLLDLIPDFLSNRRDDARALREALEADNLAAATGMGHSLKGLGGGYGFDEVTRLGALIEQASENGDAATALRALEELEAYLDRVEPFADPDAEW